MEFRTKKRTLAVLSGLILLAPAVCAQQELRYEAWHVHSRSARVSQARRVGTLIITETSLSFQETYRSGKTPKHPHAWNWGYQEIQQLKMLPKSVTVLTYKDNKWKFGADREYKFDLVSEKTFDDAFNVLRNRLDQRFVAAIPDRISEVLWEIPVKHLLRFGGDEGVLQAGRDEIVYKSAKSAESRTWRYGDIENISSSGPFQLTITTFERAKTHYGNLKGFNFALKERLEEARYNDLWLRLNQSKGLKILNSYRGAGTAQNQLSKNGWSLSAGPDLPRTLFHSEAECAQALKNAWQSALAIPGFGLMDGLSEPINPLMGTGAGGYNSRAVIAQ